MRVGLAVLLVTACGHHATEDKTLATVDGEVTALGADASSLYAGVMTLGKTSIVRLAKTGGAPTTIAANLGLVRGIAVVGDSLAWAETSVDSDDGSGAIVVTGDQIAKAGGVAQAVSAGTDHPARILTVPLAGGTPTHVATFAAVPEGLAADANDFYVLSFGTWPKGGDIDPTAGSVIAVPRAGGAPRVIADHLVRPSSLALGASEVSWNANGARWHVAKTGGAPQRDGAAAAASLAIELADGVTTYRAVKDKSGERTTIVVHAP